MPPGQSLFAASADVFTGVGAECFSAGAGVDSAAGADATGDFAGSGCKLASQPCKRLRTQSGLLLRLLLRRSPLLELLLLLL